MSGGHHSRTFVCFFGGARNVQCGINVRCYFALRADLTLHTLLGTARDDTAISNLWSVGQAHPVQLRALGGRGAHLWRAATRARVSVPVPRGDCVRRFTKEPSERARRVALNFGAWVGSSGPRGFCFVFFLPGCACRSQFQFSISSQNDASEPTVVRLGAEFSTYSNVHGRTVSVCALVFELPVFP